ASRPDASSVLTRLGAEAAAEGDAVYRVSCAPPASQPYGAAKAIATALTGADDAGFLALCDRDLTLGPIERAGVFEMLSPEGLRGMPGRSRAAAVAAALSALI